MGQYIETTVDKFIFKVATDRYYTPQGVWAKVEQGKVRVGISDYVQQRSGDVAFVELQPEGAEIDFGAEVAAIETIKLNLSLGSPLAGKIVRANPALEEEPELINQDPYGAGWLVVVEPADWGAALEHLLTPQAYFAAMEAEALSEARKDH